VLSEHSFSRDGSDVEVAQPSKAIMYGRGPRMKEGTAPW
jgi:hypothetical protein